MNNLRFEKHQKIGVNPDLQCFEHYEVELGKDKLNKLERQITAGKEFRPRRSVDATRYEYEESDGFLVPYKPYIKEKLVPKVADDQRKTIDWELG